MLPNILPKKLGRYTVFLIEVKSLKTNFYTEAGVVRAVNGVSFNIRREMTLGVVGESGCGKSVTALSIMGLIRPPGKIESGEILFHRKNGPIDLTKLDPKGAAMRSIRGNEIAMIFQEPTAFLNPVYTIGNQIMESIMLHQHLNRKEAKDKAIDMLRAVGVPAPEHRIDEYPHQLSGGLCQRAMIAMALSCNPALLIADEPTTALDVTIQAQILKLINELRKKFNTSVLLITHDLGVIAKTCDNVALMYAGYMVEYTDVHTFFKEPLHPYAQALLKSIPRLDVDAERLKIIQGLVPNLLDLPTGCPFHPRCEYCFEPCTKTMPPLVQAGKRHWVRCYLVGGL